MTVNRYSVLLEVFVTANSPEEAKEKVQASFPSLGLYTDGCVVNLDEMESPQNDDRPA